MKCKNLFIIGFVLAAFGAIAQTVTDNRVWTKLTYRIEPVKGIDVDLSGLYRNVGGDEGAQFWPFIILISICNELFIRNCIF